MKRLKAWFDRIFPTYTQCGACGCPLPKPDRFGCCTKCNQGA